MALFLNYRNAPYSEKIFEIKMTFEKSLKLILYKRRNDIRWAVSFGMAKKMDFLIGTAKRELQYEIHN